MITIIGAGVIGLAVAAQVAGKGQEVYILEKNETFGRETSSRNSETIHAGIYYHEGSLKAKTCVAGNVLLYDLCQRYGIGHRKTGKLIVATQDEEVGKLEALLEQRPNFDCLDVSYRQVLESPEEQARRVGDFLALPLDSVKMAQIVDPQLYRNRR